jgi:hypothetical protein
MFVIIFILINKKLWCLKITKLAFLMRNNNNIIYNFDIILNQGMKSLSSISSNKTFIGNKLS